MKTIGEITLSEAEKVFAVANTPLFLLRKLRSEPAVNEVKDMSQKFTADEILKALRVAAKKKPSNFAESVRPYALLVALSFKSDVAHLKKAARISTRHYKWLSYLTDVLIQTIQPASLVKISPRTRQQFEPSTTTSTGASKFILGA